MHRLAVVLALAVAALGMNATAETAKVSYFKVSEGAGPHDVAPAPDGAVWYTAQLQGALGRLDPKTGKVEQISLGAGSAPHGVIIGPDRAAWITDGGQNAIVRYDPQTKKLKSFPLPDNFPNANLNTATFDRKGILWFTGQNGIYGRVDPATGKMEVWKAPKGTGPYGITTTPKGDVWYASLAGDHIAKIDTVSGDAAMVAPPKPGVGPRRIWSDSKNQLWVSFWNTGELGRYDPIAKTWKAWKLPNSKTGCYAVYVDDKDIVWVSDFVANAILRFDPATEKFQSFPSNRRGAAVRQLNGRPGEVWGAESGTDRLVVIRE
ncbi:MAG TPA: SMP-30/gluconolactonase/LRE family protein [Pseudolabrys sp.]|nr:SMP-30/gluconolactonase/LRE family protein [Pseudolabrys sp.]